MYCIQGTYLLIRWWSVMWHYSQSFVICVICPTSLKKTGGILKYSVLLSPSQRVYILAKTSLSSLSSIIATFRIDIYAMYFRSPAVERLFQLPWTLLTISFWVSFKTATVYISDQEMPTHELIICCTSYHLQQTSGTPQRAPEFNSVQCIGINDIFLKVIPWFSIFSKNFFHSNYYKLETSSIHTF